MKKIFILLIFVFYMFITPALAVVIEGNISMSDKIPSELFGSWRVEAKCTRSTNKNLFATGSTDIWTLKRNGETITLSNPVSGASADINVSEVKGKTVKFVKKSYYPDEESIETPVLTLQGDNFTGVDKISIKTYKNGELLREDYVEYHVKGTKISGTSVKGIFGI